MEYKHGAYYYPELIPGTWVTKDNILNDYNIDRVAQRNFSYTGIKTFPLQDIAMVENQWGPVQDRTKEHLISLDYRILHIRQRLLKAAKALLEGIEPPAPWHPEEYRYHRESSSASGRDEAATQARIKARMSLVPANEQTASIPS